MGFFDDFRLAIDDYVDESVDIDIVDFEEPGDRIDEGEICFFKVRVNNRGQLDLRSVVLHINGISPYTTVSPDGTSFSAEFYTGAQDIESEGEATFPQQGDGTFHMSADDGTPTNVNVWVLLSIHISSFDAHLGHLLRDHTLHGAGPTLNYIRHIHPQSGPQ